MPTFPALLAIAITLATLPSVASAQLESIVFLQNEVADSNGRAKAITQAVALLSRNSNGNGAISRSLRTNGQDISVNNPLGPGDQAEPLTVSASQGFKWVQLRYRVEGSSTNVFTGACIITRGQGGGNDHYIQQVFIRPKSTDGRQTQFQPEDMRKPRSVGTDSTDAAVDDSIYVLNRMYSAVNVFIVGRDGGIGRMYRLAAGSAGRFTGCPPWQFAISAFAVGDNSLQHVGRVHPGLAVYELLPNQEDTKGGRDPTPSSVEPSVGYQRHQE